MLLAIFSRLKDRELSNTLSKLGYRSAEIEAIEKFPERALDIQKELAGKKTKTPIDAYRYIEKIPMEYVGVSSRGVQQLRRAVQAEGVPSQMAPGPPGLAGCGHRT